jgi:hypothetical protein
MEGILLQEATTEQFFEELKARYPSHIFGGVCACQKDDSFEFHQGGDYLTRRGLLAICGEHMSHEARQNYEDFYSNKDD